MKLLHSKSSAEPILAVSACPCANLFGLVTFSAVTVFRSTTLTTVFTFALTPFQPTERSHPTAAPAGQPGASQAEHYHCCWSPSGRLFTVALPSGFILIFDVEGGTLARVFATAAANSTRGEAAAAAAAAALPAASASSSPASPFSPTATSSFLTTVPWVESTLPSNSPVLALTWCGVPSLAAAQLTAMAAEVQTRCLPVRLGVTSALFDEATQGLTVGVGGSEATGKGFDPLTGGAAGEDGELLSTRPSQSSSSSATLVSLLTVLGSDGVLRCFVGGLYEVFALPLSLPAPFAKANLSWADVQIEDMQWQQCACDASLSLNDDGHGSPRRQKTIHRGSHISRALVAFGDSALAPVLPATQQHHRLYLVVRACAPSGTTPAPSVLCNSHVLWEACVQSRLTGLAMPPWLALCNAREYVRLAQEAYDKALQGWYGVLRGRVLAHLGLPAAAPLLASAVVAQVTDPDPIALYKYAKQTLMRAELVEDLEVLARTFRTVAYEVTHVCYRCCEAAMSYAVHTAGDEILLEGEPSDAPVDALVNEQHRGTAGAAVTAASTAAGAAGDVSSNLLTRIGALRRRHEAFLRQATSEGECARDLALWVLQQSTYWESGTHFVMTQNTNHNAMNNNNNNYTSYASGGAGYGEEDRRDPAGVGSSPTADPRAGSPPPALQPAPAQPVLIDEEPVSATRQPALYDFLINIAATYGASPGLTFTKEGRVVGTSFCQSDEACSYDTQAAKIYEEFLVQAEQCTRAFTARSSVFTTAQEAAVACQAVTGQDVVQADTERQLLCCVVAREEEDENAASTSADTSGDQGGNLDSEDDADSTRATNKVQRQLRGEGDNEEEERCSQPSAHSETDVDDLSVDGGRAEDGESGVFAPAEAYVSSQSAKLYALHASARAGGLLDSLRLSSGHLQVKSVSSSSNGQATSIDDEEASPYFSATAAASATEAEQHQEVEQTACEWQRHSYTDVDTASVEKYLKADFTRDKSAAFTSSWYGFLEEDRHVLVCQPAAVLRQSGAAAAAKLARSTAPFFIAVVQDDGELVIADEREEEEEEEEEEEDDGEEEGQERKEEAASAADASTAQRAALCQVTGMEGVPMRVSMSRARNFCVVVGVAKYVVVSLYDDDY